MLLTSSIPLDVIIFSTLAIYILYRYVTRNFNYFKDKGIPYIKPVPIFGNFAKIALFRTTIGEWLKSYYDKMDVPYFGIFVFNTPCMVIKSPELVRDIIIKDFSHFFDRSTPMPKHEELQQGMMLLQKGKEWKETREKFTSAFTSGKLRKMFPELNTYAEKLIKYIKHIDYTKINIQDCTLRYATDTLLRSFVGIEAYCLEEDSEVYLKMKSAMAPSYESGLISVSFFFRLRTLIEYLKLSFPQTGPLNFFADMFQHLVKVGKENDTKISNLIDIVNGLKNNESYVQKFTYGDRKSVGQPFMFFMAGENTIVSTLAYVLYELAKHPEAQRKLRNEITEAKGDDAEFSYDKVVGMKYMEMVVQEVLRMYPPLPFLDRECTNDYTIKGTNITIPKGQQVYIPMYGFNFDKKIFPEPDKFIPERFSSKSKYNQNGIRFFPFGEGPRLCIGERFALLDIKTAVAHVLTNFEMEITPDTPQKLHFTPFSFGTMSKDPIYLNLKPLTNSSSNDIFA